MLPGQTISRTLTEMFSFISDADFNSLAAVKNNQVFIIDGTQSFGKADLSLPVSIEIFAEIIHPKQFNFGFEGSGWVRFAL